VSKPGERKAAIEPGKAVSMLSRALDEEFTLIGSLAGGETGATAVQGSDGRRFVLKWELDPENQLRRREGVNLAERFRTAASWPCPEQQITEISGCLLVLQAFMPGENVDRLSHDLIDTLFEMDERRRGLATDEDQNRWARHMIEILIEGGNGYCLHQPLRDFDSRTRRVVERIEEIGRSLTPSDLLGSDVVHGDLHPGNLLQIDGRLSAVIDLDYTRVGDADFDLAMLALTSLGVHADAGVRRRLFDCGIKNLPDAKRNAYIGNLLLRFLDWPIRKSRPAEIEFWLVEADRLLPSM
jgi:thiamine kinase-like enzyme